MGSNFRKEGQVKRFIYYQPNEKDLKDRFGDCTIRALSKAMNCSWLEAFDAEVPFCSEDQCSNIFDVPIKVRKVMMDRLGFDYTGVPKKARKRPTVESFAKDHKEGTFILNVAHHEVAVVDGKYYDTWDCGKKSVYGYFTKRREG